MSGEHSQQPIQSFLKAVEMVRTGPKHDDGFKCPRCHGQAFFDPLLLKLYCEDCSRLWMLYKWFREAATELREDGYEDLADEMEEVTRPPVTDPDSLIREIVGAILEQEEDPPDNLVELYQEEYA